MRIHPAICKLQAAKVEFISEFLPAFSRVYIIHHSIYFICFCVDYYINNIFTEAVRIAAGLPYSYPPTNPYSPFGCVNIAS